MQAFSWTGENGSFKIRFAGPTAAMSARLTVRCKGLDMYDPCHIGLMPQETIYGAKLRSNLDDCRLTSMGDCSRDTQACCNICVAPDGTRPPRMLPCKPLTGATNEYAEGLIWEGLSLLQLKALPSQWQWLPCSIGTTVLYQIIARPTGSR